jgi:hypothetical protein
MMSLRTKWYSKRRIIIKKLLILGLFLLAGTFSVSAQNLPSVRITNNTGFDVYYVYISPSSSDDWGEDMLGDDILLDGYSVDIQLGYPLSRVSTYDIYLEDEEGDTYSKYEVKLTNNARIVFTEEDLEF